MKEAVKEELTWTTTVEMARTTRRKERIRVRNAMFGCGKLEIQSCTISRDRKIYIVVESRKGTWAFLSFRDGMFSRDLLHRPNFGPTYLGRIIKLFFQSIISVVWLT